VENMKNKDIQSEYQSYKETEKALNAINRYNIKLTISGDILTVAEFEKVNRKKPIIKQLKNGQWVNVITGEVFEARSENRKNNIQKSMSMLRDIVNTNCTEPKNLHWITLTYKDVVNNTKELKKDFNYFIARLNYYIENKLQVKKPEYITAIEPCEKNNRWHYHMILIWNDKKPYIKNETLADLWKKGFVKIQAVDNVDNIGAYLSAYLTNTIDKQGKKNKGGRLHLYPPNMKFYRFSKGIKKPDIVWATSGQAKNITNEYGTPVYETLKTYRINEELIFINYKQYNKKRKGSEVK
jgi:hypothetical protein